MTHHPGPPTLKRQGRPENHPAEQPVVRTRTTPPNNQWYAPSHTPQKQPVVPPNPHPERGVTPTADALGTP
ncbi:hypothetical protein GCM10010346_27810 [Streptomyces chryseus]|uniref:Uncharacterized protein n=1 Tax=Streptomyces chryseus TaxID=68186 RepID=A0ABQ3DK54_9ACTN|nr:hypothetical protein GCM10010346_27810 [Streptomyces chryseus]